MGFTTILTLNPWDFGLKHDIFLSTLSKYNLSLGLSFKPDLDGIVRKNLGILKENVDAHNVTIEFIFLDYPLDFDNAESFFIWTYQVRGWMAQQNITSPLLVRFFPEVNNDATIKSLLERWDTVDFDGWVIEKYSVDGMKDWINEKLQGHKKKAFFLYGADKWNTSHMEPDYESQANQIVELVNFMTQNHIDSPLSNYSQLLGGAIVSYSDISYLGRSPSYFLGGKGDICPDKNPYLTTSCGGMDVGIKFGDQYYSVERMGLFDYIEKPTFIRCVKPTLAAQSLVVLWGGSNSSIVTESSCVLTFSLPGIYVYVIWAIGFVLAIVGLILGCWKSYSHDRLRFRREHDRNKLEDVKVEESLIKKKTKSKKNESESN